MLYQSSALKHWMCLHIDFYSYFLIGLLIIGKLFWMYWGLYPPSCSVAQAGSALTMYPALNLNSYQSSCLSLPSAGLQVCVVTPAVVCVLRHASLCSLGWPGVQNPFPLAC